MSREKVIVLALLRVTKRASRGKGSLLIAAVARIRTLEIMESALFIIGLWMSLFD